MKCYNWGTLSMRTYESTKNLLVTLRNGKSERIHEIDHLVNIFDRITKKMRKE